MVCFPIQFRFAVFKNWTPVFLMGNILNAQGIKNPHNDVYSISVIWALLSFRISWSSLVKSLFQTFYRSSLQGKGLNRFWSNVEGCNGPLVMLIAAQEDNSNTRKWIIGVLINQGFENREMFYGNSGSLYAI